MSWCVGWLEDHQVDHGWQEVLGLDDTSLHQTALALHALAQLRDTLHELGPGLRLAAGVDTTSLLKRAEPPRSSCTRRSVATAAPGSCL